MRISLRSKVVASYVGIILLTVVTVLVVHDMFMRSSMRGHHDFEDNLDRAAAIVQSGVDAGTDFQTIKRRLDELDTRTATRCVVIGTGPDFPYPNIGELPSTRPHRGHGWPGHPERREPSPGAGGGPGPGGPGFGRGPFGGIRTVVHGGATVALVLSYPVGPPQHRHPDDFRHVWAVSLMRSIAIATCLALLAALPLAGHLTRPLRHLEKVARRFAQGNLTARADLHRGDEIGSLAGAFNEMADSIQHDIETRTRLLNDVSHELATPVTTIRATLEGLIDGVVPAADHRRYLESLLKQAEHLSFLVDDVTEVARFESGDIRLEWGRFSACEPAQEAVEAAQLRGAPVEFTTVCDSTVAVEGDPRRLLQVLQNLIGNAQHHNPPGTAIRVGCQALADRVIYSVEDEGPPIPDHEAERIFERFYKLDSARSRGRGGGGLGLAIVKQIVEAHHSQIRVEGGKRFVFELQRVC